MKIYKLLSLVFLFTVFYGNRGVAQQLDFGLHFNDATAQYEVIATPDFSNNKYFIGGGSQISILLPQDIEDVPLQITTVAGGLWTDNSRIFAPVSDHIHDFHGIASNGAMVNFVEGEPLLLFTFELPGGVCRSDVRLFENTEDRRSNEAGMNGGDFRNFVANVFEPTRNSWGKTTSFINEVCAYAPSVAPNSLTTEENIPATICMPIVDLNTGDTFKATQCASVSQSTNGISNITVSGNELCLEFIPSEGFVGSESVCIEVCDDTGLCNTSTIAISVIAEPVYSSFSVSSDACQNTLDWTIFNPSKFEYFELERSEEGVDYEVLGLFNSNVQVENMEFNYVDEQVDLGYFYRLKLVFLDGQIKYSKSIFVNTSCDQDFDTSHAVITATANSCENQVSWTINNLVTGASYELQRSMDGNEFVALDEIESSANMPSRTAHFTDSNTKGDHYYRVELAYEDGREEYSANVFVPSDCKVEDGFIIYPNPVSDSRPILNLKFISETKSVNILVTDVLGQVLRRINLEVELGINIYRLDVIDLTVGTYFIAIEGKENKVKSFVKIEEGF